MEGKSTETELTDRKATGNPCASEILSHPGKPQNFKKTLTRSSGKRRLPPALAPLCLHGSLRVVKASRSQRLLSSPTGQNGHSASALCDPHRQHCSMYFPVLPQFRVHGLAEANFLQLRSDFGWRAPMQIETLTSVRGFQKQ